MENYGYSFLVGLYIGKYTSAFSDLIITGLILYIVRPDMYTKENIDKAKTYAYNLLKINNMEN